MKRLVFCTLVLALLVPPTASAHWWDAFTTVLKDYDAVRLALSRNSLDGVEKHAGRIEEELNHLYKNITAQHAGVPRGEAVAIYERLPAMIEAAKRLKQAQALTRISHHLPTAGEDIPAIVALLPATAPATCLKHASAASWSKTHTDRHLHALATKVGEQCGLSQAREAFLALSHGMAFWYGVTTKKSRAFVVRCDDGDTVWLQGKKYRKEIVNPYEPGKTDGPHCSPTSCCG